MSFLTDNEIASLRIRQMIVHVVGGKEEFEPQPVMDGVEHIDFFLARIQDAAASGVHRFESKSTTKALLQQIGSQKISFEEGAQELSRRFSNDHVGSSRDGAFFVFELETDDPRVLFYSLIKYDYRQAIELYAHKGRNALRQIVHAFVREKRAIQKSCLVRVKNGVVESGVSAIDRMGDAPDLTDYFQKFLEVVRDRDAKELSERLNEVIRGTLQKCKMQLPDQDVPSAVSTTKDFLRGRENVDDESIREALFVAAGRPNEDVRAEIEKVLSRQLKDKKLAGVTFKPDPESLRRAPRRKVQTKEGVLLIYPGEQENRAVSRQPNGSGGWTITIRTSEHLVEDGTLPEKSRADA
ncbi:nucleoid-associated protein [Bradyrhizobium sp. B117]|uniref:nucleoid-associated protein n=1 Tax=Bradyrhizobium sp. B117 TaxID=3140246 RepID=UPI0031846295